MFCREASAFSFYPRLWPGTCRLRRPCPASAEDQSGLGRPRSRDGAERRELPRGVLDRAAYTGIEFDDRGEELMLEPNTVELSGRKGRGRERVLVEHEELLLDPDRPRLTLAEGLRNHRATLRSKRRVRLQECRSEARAGGRASDRLLPVSQAGCSAAGSRPLGEGAMDASHPTGVFGWRPSLTVTSFVSFWRWTSSVISSPGCFEVTTLRSCSADSIGWPSTFVITSPPTR